MTLPIIYSFDPESGSSGTEVEILGSLFTGVTAVNFVGRAGAVVPATSFSIDSDTQITAVVPIGARTGLISLVGPGGGPANTAATLRMFRRMPRDPGRRVQKQGVDDAAPSDTEFIVGRYDKRLRSSQRVYRDGVNIYGADGDQVKYVQGIVDGAFFFGRTADKALRIYRWLAETWDPIGSIPAYEMPKGSFMIGRGIGALPRPILVGANNEVPIGDSSSSPGVVWGKIGPQSINILTTAGDIMVFDTAHSRLAIGNNNDILSVDTSLGKKMKWRTFASYLTAINADILPVGDSGNSGVSIKGAPADHVHALGGTVGGDLTGTMPNPAVAAGAISNSKLRSSVAYAVIGRAAGTIGVVADIVAGDGTLLGRTAGGNVAFGALALDQIPAALITYAKLQNVGIGKILGNRTGAPAAAQELADPLGLSLLLTGAASATRYVGGTASGAPSSGTFAVGDFVIDQSGMMWICTAAGSPGTWTNKSSEVSAIFASSGVQTVRAGTLRWYNDTGRTLTIVKARASAGTAPTGAALICDINVNGTTIWSTQGNRVQIAASANAGTQTSFNTGTVADGDYLTVDVDQIGSTVAGSDLVVQLLMRG